MGQRIIAFVNQKGGVAKTSTATTVSRILVNRGFMVVLVDMDPQANATSDLGLEPDECSPNIYHALVGSADVKEIIKQIDENFFILPSNIDLATAEIELPTLPGKDHRLKGLIERLSNADFVIIDSPPSLGQLSLNVLTAATEFIIPTQCQKHSVKGLQALFDKTITSIRQHTNRDLRFTGIVRTMFNVTKSGQKQISKGLEAQYKDKVFKSIIPQAAAVESASLVGQTVVDYDKSNPSAVAYESLVDEILEVK